MQQLIENLRQKRKHLRLGGGQKALEKIHAKGKMTAWERIDYLLKGSPYIEIGGFAGEGMYEKEGGCPNGGVAIVMGYIQEKLCLIVSNDASVKAGAWFPITAKKILRAQEIAIENKLPIIYLVDSAGVYLPLQDEIFPDKEHFGRVFRNNAKLSAMGVPQISAIMGSCVAGGAYLPIMSDYAFIVKGTGSVFLAGPYLVKSAIGEETDAETLGGAETHSMISGVTDNQYEDDNSCLDAIISLFSRFGEKRKTQFSRTKPESPAIDPKEIYKILPTDRTQPYDSLEILRCIVDKNSLEEYKKDYGKTIICAFARIDGWSVGIVANRREIVKAKKPGGSTELQMGGVIYNDSADKAARFIMNCNQQLIPLVFLQDVTGFMVGSRSEQLGIIKDGAKLVNAMANSIVPKFTFMIGNSYGAGNYALCGRAYDPRLIFSWPTARIGVMSGASAGKTLLQIEQSKLAKTGQQLDEEEEKILLDKIQEQYDKQLDPYYAAARLWTDGIIDPIETRTVISMGIKAASHSLITDSYKVGVIQT